jgi:hypothetical protein
MTKKQAYAHWGSYKKMDDDNIKILEEPFQDPEVVAKVCGERSTAIEFLEEHRWLFINPCWFSRWYGPIRWY